MNAITAPIAVREAVDHARLLVTISEQILECLCGDREHVYIAFNHTMLCSAENRASIAEVLEHWLMDEYPEVGADLLTALDNDYFRARLLKRRNELIHEIAGATLSRLTPDELEALT
ncbi:hypothetical protein L1889_18085 [Paenalcaligenes niemegkensis]|uniref:hypothetical protein n=1 Tax=Paenalcaligenes niemegkensis TaxID=2895469 RepID=UPI001EE976EE|nr:hypothetical protein [Paenalcaligenes niemegkensis]MCQ9618350.1 hypothetical protein [Paenalcaligenes niemegkensis]